MKLIKGEMCKRHRPKNKVMGYIEHSEWLEKMNRWGRKQIKCKRCNHYLHKSEF